MLKLKKGYAYGKERQKVFFGKKTTGEFFWPEDLRDETLIPVATEKLK